MSYHPFPLFVPAAGRTNGPDIPTEEIVRMSKIRTSCELADILSGYVRRFNESESLRIRKKEIEQVAFFRGVHFPEIGEILHPNRISICRKGKKVLLRRFVVSGGDIVIECLKDSSQFEYEEVKRFPLHMIKLVFEMARKNEEKSDDYIEYEFTVTALWRTDSIENAAFDSVQL